MLQVDLDLVLDLASGIIVQIFQLKLMYVFIKQCKVSHLLQQTAVPAKLCSFTDAINSLRTQT